MISPLLPSELDSLRATVERLESEQTWSRTILETVPAVVLRVSLDGMIEFINRVLPEYQNPHPVGQSIYAFAPADQHEVMRSALERTTRTLQPSSFESIAEAPDGTRDWYVTNVGPILDGGQLVGFMFVCTNASRARQAEAALVDSRARLKLALDAGDDVTERRLIDEHLRQAQKLEAVGQLSAGVAHNFNNMLAVILPALERAKAHAKEPDVELLDDAITSASNAAQLVRQLMVFSRSGQRTAAQHERLAEVVRRAVELCRQTFERSVTLELGALDAAQLASVDSGAMEQVVVNLLLNARDALVHELGRPTRIDVRAQLLDERAAARRHVEARGDYVELRVTDTGCGMDATTQRRMLEPFFTTKAVGRGTGLGLSTAWATVQAHHGFLECDSEVGRGTTFSLLLPVREARTHVAAATPAPVAGNGGGRVVLIIDDENNVRRATAALLKEAGFSVLSAASGEEGLRVAADAPVDVVLLDYSMPGLSPQETMAGLRRDRPRLPVICLSGLETQLAGATSQLTKPVALEALVAALEAALAAR